MTLRRRDRGFRLWVAWWTWALTRYVGTNVEEWDAGRPMNMRHWLKGRVASLFSV
ncbi:hypothetical protein ERO13_A11G280900v2 [Gossypium hirsutum]|uniref:Uncharacterized protein n=3 Tax=Gossypium TaxID=3633 RepID=A0A5D2XCU4_GOSMU|nr:hypothetical protein ERO13_A11G280900v2 [Gossypium hirsutum]TYG96189.1 hypothetical protein ES288_A11G328800v1 [Gossypium darwinii]TYI03262.1 hypothetical protein ES332_A11G325100v1 [Gossypium tomentosum]TYJ11877.1 hypothetical protein E1A91_A11G307900v1 [Gossypium mustelinum]